MSVGDLILNKKYLVEKLARLETKFGMAVLSALYDEDTGGVIEVFLPKSVQLSIDEEVFYNARLEKDLVLINEGKIGWSFKIKFQQL